MCEINKTMLEYLYSDASEVFETKEFTNQQLYLIYTCWTWLPVLRINYSFLEKNIVRKIFLTWQNNEIPSMDWVIPSYKEYSKKVKEFSHFDDFRWVELDHFIDRFVMLNREEIGCKTYQEHLKNQIIEEKDGVFE